MSRVGGSAMSIPSASGAGADAVRQVRPDAGGPVGRRVPTAGPVGPSPETLARIRLRFTKLGKVRWTSHRDVARMWERALRRAGLPVAYSGGFSPHPLLSFGLALPTGCESTAEYVDVALDPVRAAAAGAGTAEPGESVGAGPEPGRAAGADRWWAGNTGDVGAWSAMVADQAAGYLSGLMPTGVDVVGAVALEVGATSLQDAVTSCTWRIAVVCTDVGMDASTDDGTLAHTDASTVAEQVAAAMASEALPVRRERKGRHQIEDLRPSLLDAKVLDAGPSGAVFLQVDTATRPRGVRPAEIADALGLRLGPACRTHQWIERDGCRWEPVVAGPTPAAIAAGCAS